MYFNFSKFWSFTSKASSTSHHEVAYGHTDYCSASTEALQNTVRLFVNSAMESVEKVSCSLWKTSFHISVRPSYTVLMVYDHNRVFCCFWLNHYLDIESKALLSVTVFDCGIYCWLLQSQI